MDRSVSAHLESIIRTAVHLVNSRNFDATSSAWADFSQDFHNDPHGPVFQQFATAEDLQILKQVDKPRNLAEFLAFHEDVATKNPNYCLKAVEVQTTHVNERAGYAHVILSDEVTGIPQGVVRRTMSAFEFRCVEGKWWCVGTKTLPGVDGCGPSGA